MLFCVYMLHEMENDKQSPGGDALLFAMLLCRKVQDTTCGSAGTQADAAHKCMFALCQKATRGVPEFACLKPGVFDSSQDCL